MTPAAEGLAGKMWLLADDGDVSQLAFFIERFVESEGDLPGAVRARQVTIDDRLAGTREFNGVPVLADEKVPIGHVWIVP